MMHSVRARDLLTTDNIDSDTLSFLLPASCILIVLTRAACDESVTGSHQREAMRHWATGCNEVFDVRTGRSR